MDNDELIDLIDEYIEFIKMYSNKGYLDYKSQIKLFKLYIDIRIGVNRILNDILSDIKNSIDDNDYNILLDKIKAYYTALKQVYELLIRIENQVSLILTGDYVIYSSDSSNIEFN
ncbi:hypothetical protein DRN84_01490 [Candidatus Geothermarchaeota archaeon]|nr:MAG: hypothetical protein DRN87_01770 [Candidatus Geothermarchaeota archaeon]RLG62608.1 MAG: hypothetical protein DRN84_01490 [Candidatus Geothermarchaeota archaeon]HEW94302.1 hypothetical protein [Thermoprotei archaeon]